MIEINGYRAVAAKIGGYYLHRPGFYNTFCGHAKTRDAAIEWLNSH